MDAYAEQQRERCWQPRPRRAKSAFRVGLMGYGVLGRAIAAALRPFGFPLACWSRARQSDAGIAFHAGIDELDAFLSGVQVLVCTLPLTRQTTGLLDGSRLARLPRGAHVVNIARGELIVDADLVSLLDAGLLGGATLDVFRQEPLPSDHAFWHHPRVTLTPHVSAATLIDESVAQVAAKIRCLEQGLPVAGVIDRETGY
jgi:glyoxylate/hydroxypyruvate reductase A